MFIFELVLAAIGVAITIVWAVLAMWRMEKQRSGREKEKAELKTVSSGNGKVLNMSDYRELCEQAYASALDRVVLGKVEKAATTPKEYSRACKNCGAPLRGNECEYCGSVWLTVDRKG